ncbi:MAG: Hsp33 family molecular chaperone HslO [Quisquiliibacterium sp.]
MSDTLQRFLLQGAPVRGQIVSLDAAWAQVLDRHELADSVRNCLGELSAAALLLSASLKFDGKLVLQIHGDGPVALFVVECDRTGSFRATVKMREGVKAAAGASLRELVNCHGGGRFVVTLDPGARSSTRQPYQGIVPFEGDTVAQVLEHYMARSEQVPTRLWLAADANRSVGLLLQRLPDEGGNAGSGAELQAQDADGWNRMQILADTVRREEMLSLPTDQVLGRLFWQEPLHAFDGRGCRFACSCSQDKVVAMLRTLGPAEIEATLAEQGSVEVSCEFCNRTYRFDAIDCASLFIEGVNDPGPNKMH